jgi:BirA family biotin operon repressor/biotin-[acetyl-CoA-carboxylase] ligase
VTFVLAAGDKVEPHQLPLVAGLAVRNAAAELTGDPDVAMKWPNDVLYQGKKLAGLLCERVRGADLVGIGINVNTAVARAPKVIRKRISSLAAIRGSSIDMTEALAVVAGHMRVTLDRAEGRSFATLLREYDQHHALIGREVCVTANQREPAVCGKCEGLDSIGRLLLRSRGKLEHVISGQVQLR